MNRNENIDQLTVAATRDFAETIQIIVGRSPVLSEHEVMRAKDHLSCLAAHMECAIDAAGEPEKETPHRRMEVTLPNGTVASITGDPDMPPETMHALTEMMRIISEQAAAGTLHLPENAYSPDPP